MWYIYERRKMKYLLIYTVTLFIYPVVSRNIDTTETVQTTDIYDNFDNNIIDFDEDYSVKFNKKHAVPWHANDKFNKESHKYTIVKDEVKINDENKTSVSNKLNDTQKNDERFKNSERVKKIVEETTPQPDFSVIPLELVSTTENILLSIIESTTEPDLTVIPLSTTKKPVIDIIKQTVILPSTQSPEISTEYFTTTDNVDKTTTVGEDNEATTTKREISTKTVQTVTTAPEFTPNTTKNVMNSKKSTNKSKTLDEIVENENNTVTKRTIEENVLNNTTNVELELINVDIKSETENPNKTIKSIENTTEIRNTTKLDEVLNTNTSKQIDTIHRVDDGSSESHEDVPIFTELDTEDFSDVPEDYYDSKDVVPTTVPKTDAISVIFGLAGSVVESVVESVAERVVPKGIFDLFKRMQRQSEALEAERLRSREENGGLGQFTRGILKSISSGLSKPLSQLMAGAKDIGSLDTDRGFVSGVVSGVTSVANVANSVLDAFKDRVQAIYPGTLWCGDGHSAQARSGDLGLFFFTDTCCRQHDACKIYIPSGETKYGLTNTGLFTRSHCSCDAKFRECLRNTNSLVSSQIGLTYFNVLGPQCFRKAHPIVKCVRRTRITGQKCEEYELDYTKPKMWQWFDNETF